MVFVLGFEVWLRQHRWVAAALTALAFGMVVSVVNVSSKDADAPLIALVIGGVVCANATAWSLTRYAVDDDEASPQRGARSGIAS